MLPQDEEELVRTVSKNVKALKLEVRKQYRRFQELDRTWDHLFLRSQQAIQLRRPHLNRRPRLQVRFR